MADSVGLAPRGMREMNTRELFFGLLLIIAGLAASLLYLLIRPFGGGQLLGSAGVVQTNLVTRILVPQGHTTNYFLPPRIFKWSELESTNYTAYIENLRSIGCPEETIRDIVVAEIAGVFAKKRAEAMAAIPPAPFWQTGARSVYSKQDGVLEALFLEQRNLVKNLLGIDLESQLTKYSMAPPERSMDFSFLNADKAAQVQSLLAHLSEEEGSALSTEEMLDLARRREDAIRQILSPEEWEEYALRYSDISSAMREELHGFQPSEEEFRKIFRLRQTYQGVIADLGKSPDSGSEEDLERIQSEAESLMQDEIKKTLGADRFAAYEKQQAPAFQTLFRMGERYELSPQVADQAYGFIQAAQEQSNKLLSDPSLDRSRVDEALQAISRETRTAVSNALGAAAFPAFQNAGGQDWMTFRRSE